MEYIISDRTFCLSFFKTCNNRGELTFIFEFECSPEAFLSCETPVELCWLAVVPILWMFKLVLAAVESSLIVELRPDAL